MASKPAEKKIPLQPNWGFCYSMLHKVSRSFPGIIQQVDTELRDAMVEPHYTVASNGETTEEDKSYGEGLYKVSILVDPIVVAIWILEFIAAPNA